MSFQDCEEGGAHVPHGQGMISAGVPAGVEVLIGVMAFGELKAHVRKALDNSTGL